MIRGAEKRRTGIAQPLVLIGIIIVLCAVTAGVNPRFLRAQNIINIFQQISILGIVACGIGMLLVAGQIDISVGSQISLMGIIAALLGQTLLGGEAGVKVPAWQAAMAVPLTVAATLLLGALLGLLNGIVVVGSKVASFVITLGFMTVYRGAALVAGRGTGYPVPRRFQQLGRARLFDLVPVSVLFFLGVILMTFFVLKYLRYGRFLYAIGGNAKAAYVSGINTARITVIAYVVVGLASALASLLLVSRVGVAQANLSDTYALDSLAAVIVGGVALSGGKGDALAIFLGILLIGLIINALIIMRVNPYARDVIMGLIIIIAVATGQRGSEAS